MELISAASVDDSVREANVFATRRKQRGFLGTVPIYAARMVFRLIRKKAHIALPVIGFLSWSLISGRLRFLQLMLFALGVFGALLTVMCVAKPSASSRSCVARRIIRARSFLLLDLTPADDVRTSATYQVCHSMPQQRQLTVVDHQDKLLLEAAFKLPVAQLYKPVIQCRL